MQPSWKTDAYWSIFPQQTAESLANINFKRNDVFQRSSKALVNQARYKTEICRSFEENKSCKYGDKCQFAHGHNEVRQTNRHPKYKTEPCRTFHSWEGFCPYGPRCHFIHNEDPETLELVRTSPSLSPLSSSSSYSPMGSPTGSSPSLSPTASFFCEEDPLVTRDRDLQSSLPTALIPSMLAASPASCSPPSHRRLPVFTSFNTLAYE